MAHSPKVLIADDSPLVLRMIEKMLEGAGLQVVSARDGLEAVEKAFASDVSLVILDVTMPRMNGYQACRLLKSEPATRELPVIILTSKDHPGDRFWGLQTGADHYVTKDAEPQRILELVQKVLAQAGGRPPRPAEAQRSGLDVLSRVNELLDRRLYEATLLSEIGRVGRAPAEFDATFAAVMALVARIVDFTVGGMAFVDDEDVEVVLVQQRACTPAVVEEAKARLMEALGREHERARFTRVQVRLLPGPGAARGREETSLGAFAAFPVSTQGRLTGLLALGGKDARVAADAEPFLAQVAAQAHLVSENARLVERLRQLSIRDSLTDLYNHRHALALVQREFERASRYGAPLSVLMVDIDHFKAINDQYGHPAGDAVARDTARVLRDTLRGVDCVGRYGGDEFLAVLPHTASDEAHQTGERLRRAVQDHRYRAGRQDLRVTVSVGVATYPSTGVDSPEDLIEAADRSMYAAKQAGLNRVV